MELRSYCVLCGTRCQLLHEPPVPARRGLFQTSTEDVPVSMSGCLLTDDSTSEVLFWGFWGAIQYKLATVVYRPLNGTAPSYLAADLRRLSDMPSRPRLLSSLIHQLDVRQS